MRHHGVPPRTAVLRWPAAAAAFVALIAGLGSTAAGAAATQTLPGNDWPEYVHDAGGSSFNNETVITVSNIGTLKMQTGWPVKLGGAVSAQPVIANDHVYAGAWDGAEYALCETACSSYAPGHIAWKRPLGQTTTTQCGSRTYGIASTAAVADVKLSGASSASPVVFVGGGGNSVPSGIKSGASVFALDANTGVVKWQAVLAAAPSAYIWGSPVVYTPSGASVPSIYIGVASLDDCPLVQGQLVQLNATDGAVQHVFDAVPNGCAGAGIWGTPSVDSSANAVYIATGNDGGCGSSEPYGPALVKLNASTLSVESSWQVPTSQQTTDSDFGSVPTLFSGTVTSGGSTRSLVGVGNKNGKYYVFDRTKVSAGPLVTLSVATGGDCPQCGNGDIAPSAWDGTTLYIPSGTTQLGSKTVKGLLRAYNPNTLTSSPRWEHEAVDGPILAAAIATPGLAAVTDGDALLVVRTDTGATVFRGYTNSRGTSNPAQFYAPPTISHGVLYTADMAGWLYAYSLNGS